MSDRIATSDGITLDAEWGEADAPTAGAVLCHPNPRYGGTMRSMVTSALFEALPPAGVTCVRFNFRGVEGSTGTFDNGVAEQLDTEAAIAALDDHLDPSIPLVLMGWSFGADVALSVTHERLAGWLGIALPMRFADPERAGRDPRPKHVLLAEHDELVDPSAISETVTTWPATTVEVIGGASHFFVGRTDRVTTTAIDFVRGF